MSAARRFSSRTFAALSVRNFRLYFIGQAISLCGTWMQTIGQAWLVLRLTNSGVALGLVTAAQFLPILILGAWGGVIAYLIRPASMDLLLPLRAAGSDRHAPR